MVALTRELVGSPPPAVAKYEWLKGVLLDHIDRRLSPGDPVPSERELADNLDVSRMTARRALNELLAEGRINRTPGLGSFVTDPTISLPVRLTSFTEDMEQRARRAGADTLLTETIAADDTLTGNLDVTWGQPVLQIVRLRSTDGEPVAIERVHLVADIVPGLAQVDLTDASLYATLARDYGIIFDGGEQVITARNAGAEDAAQLRISVGDAVLHLRRTSTWRGRRVDFTTSVYRGDRYELTTRL
ncbi:MAG: GntR family transcriptional regulator [Propioniciclava sp.]